MMRFLSQEKNKGEGAEKKKDSEAMNVLALFDLFQSQGVDCVLMIAFHFLVWRHAQIEPIHLHCPFGQRLGRLGFATHDGGEHVVFFSPAQ